MLTLLFIDGEKVMKTPKTGDVVRVLDIADERVDYLTIGKEYHVINTPGTESSFSVVSDYGAVLYCLYPSCAHAAWEIV